MVTAIVFSCILYALAYLLIRFQPVASPCCAFLGMLILSWAKNEAGYPLVPMDSSLIFGWLCVTVLVTVVTLLQPRALRDSRFGIWYMTGGAIAGLAIGLLGYTFTLRVQAMYAVMIIAVAAGTFLGFLSFTRTPEGRRARAGSGNFFSYMLAKGFPIALTVMMTGVVLVIIIALNNITSRM